MASAYLWSWFALLTCCCGWTLAQDNKYLGVGYNLLTGNPDGGIAQRGGVDPGLLLTRRILNLSDSRAVISSTRHSCGDQESVNTFYSAKSYQDKLAIGVNLGGSASLKLVEAKFSLSSRFVNAKNETNENRKVFQDAQHVCNLGHMRFADEMTDYLNVTVTDSFAASICRLPETYNEKAYMNFLDHWGTHYTTEVDIGTKVIHRSESSWAQFVRHVVKSSSVDVSLGGSYKGFGASLGVNFENYKGRDSYKQSFGTHKETLEVGTEDMPEPIQVTLVSIDTALNAKYWDLPESLKSRGLCDVNVKTDVIRTNLLKSLHDYVAYKMAQPPSDPKLVVPLTWPRGSYGLVQAKSGCPADRVKWYDDGYRLFDTDNVGTYNIFTPNLHMAGSFPTYYDITMKFCVKGDPVISEFDVDWPAGDYCIFKYGSCPTGFKPGAVQWDDNDIGNVNRKGGTVPDGYYDHNTRIDFCCRGDGLPTQHIYMPIDHPFYLMAHSQRGCQRIHKMNVREEIVHWDEAPHIFFGLPKLSGDHPFDDGGQNHRLHFCYYSQSSTTTTATTKVPAGSNGMVG